MLWLLQIVRKSLSSLELIGDFCFAGTGIEEVSILDSVSELCHGCFQDCMSLQRTMFGSSSSRVAMFYWLRFGNLSVFEPASKDSAILGIESLLLLHCKDQAKIHCLAHRPERKPLGSLRPAPNPNDVAHGHTLHPYAKK